MSSACIHFTSQPENAADTWQYGAILHTHVLLAINMAA